MSRNESSNSSLDMNHTGIFRLLVGSYHDNRCDFLGDYSIHSNENTIVGFWYYSNSCFYPFDCLHP